MEQALEFRVLEKFAGRLFSETEGKKLSSGLIRKIILKGDDPRVQTIAALQAELSAKGESFFHGWEIHRKYSRQELMTAELLQLIVTSVFEPAAEENGTMYDDTTACQCGAGAERLSPLILTGGRIPRRDISRTIANEVVASKRIEQLFRREGLTGVRFDPVYLKGSNPLLASPHFREFVINQHDVEIADETRIGSGLFGSPEDELYRCGAGELLGIGLLSELWFNRSTRGVQDVQATRQFLGVRRGLLRPHHSILISPRLGEILLRERVTGFKLEVARAAA
jgi:hypothetical protein